MAAAAPAQIPPVQNPVPLAQPVSNPDQQAPEKKSRWSKLRNSILFWPGVCLAALAIMALIFFYPDGSSPAMGTLVARSPASTTQPLEVQASLTASVLATRKDSLNLDVVVFNQSKRAVTPPALSVNAPGFSFKTPLPQCAVSGVSLGPAGLQPGNSCTFELPLAADAYTGDYPIAVIVGWSQSRADSLSLRLGPVHFDGMWGAARWARFGHRIDEILKDLTLPLLLAILANVFATKQKKREEAAQKAEQARQTMAQEAEKKRDERQQIRQLLLNQVMAQTQKYYMPITACGNVLLGELQKVEANAADPSSNHDASPDRVLFNLLNLTQIMDSLRREYGGIFLDRMDAEKIVSYSWGVFKGTLNSVLTENQIALAIANPDWLDSFSAFEFCLDSFDVARARLSQWIQTGEPEDSGPDGSGINTGATDNSGKGRKRGKLSEYAGLIDLMQAVLTYEYNHILDEDWYGKMDDLTWTLAGDKPVTLPSTGDLTEMQKKWIKLIREKSQTYFPENFVEPNKPQSLAAS